MPCHSRSLLLVILIQIHHLYSSETLPTSCVQLLSQGITTSGTYLIYPYSASPSTSFTVYCDQSTDGGGWMLTYAYNHVGGANDALVRGTIPTDPSSGYSHVDVGTIYGSGGYTEADIESVRFYCTSSLHNRVVHFKTSAAFQRGPAWDSDLSGNAASFWSSGFTALGEHTAYLPSWTDGGFSTLSGGLWDFPFYRGAAYHWGIRGEGTRWECDDWANNAAYSTQHLIYVRMACPAGQYGSGVACSACPAGRYGSTSGLFSSACTGACPSGRFSLAGATSCTACPTGHVRSVRL